MVVTGVSAVLPPPGIAVGATASLAFLQTKGAIRLIRAYSEIGSRTTKYALVVLAESLRNKEKG